MVTGTMSSVTMAQSEGGGQPPRAVIHKRILDAAKEQPDASLTELAGDIAGASVELVEQVLEEYGDPVDGAEETAEPEQGIETEQSNEVEEEASSTTTEPAAIDEPEPKTSSWEDLTEKQRETLRAVRNRLSATQEEIGKVLGVSGATISNRLSDIEGFDWEERQDFVSEMGTPRVVSDGHGQAVVEPAEELEERLSELEERLDSLPSFAGSESLSPDLAHKIVHAIMASEEFTKDEELEVIKALM
jgi:transcriptional regulator with XRE-family HTH domain